MISKKATEVHPDIKGSGFDWIGVYGLVALGGEAVRFENYFEPAERWYDVSAYNDAPGYFAVVFRDITEKRQAEEDLLALKTFNDSIVQNINEGIVNYNNSGKATFTNPAMLQMVAYEADELIGTHWALLVSPQYQQLLEDTDARRNAGGSDRYELEVKHKNGSLIPAQISGSPYYDSRKSKVLIEPCW